MKDSFRTFEHLMADEGRLTSAESALLRITGLMGIVAETGDDGCYDVQALQAQVADVLGQRQADQLLEVTPTPTILTASGMPLSLTYPSWRLIDDQDIAQALSRICRFGGHTRQFYSVAQHCVLASELVPPEDALVALLHDAPEAYIGDMVTPLKAMMPAFKCIEARIWAAIAKRFDIDPVMPASVKRIDLALLATERRDLLDEGLGAPWPCLTGVTPLSETIVPWSAEEARRHFLARLDNLAMGVSLDSPKAVEGGVS